MNLAHIVDPHPETDVACVGQGQPVTYGELRRAAGGLGAALVERGVEPGDRIVVACANTVSFVVSYLGVLRAGAVAVPLNPLSPPAEMGRELAAIDAVAAIVGPRAAGSWTALDEATRAAVQLVVAAPGASLPGAEALDDLAATDPAPPVPRDDGDLAALLFTSGTAGAPRAAMLTHGNLRSNLEQTQRHPGRALERADRVLGVLPLHHIFGLNVALGLTLYVGARLVLVERFDPSSCLELVAAEGITAVSGAPPLWGAWANLPDADRGALASVRIAASGAAPLDPDVAQRIHERFGVRIGEGYGLTEASPVVTSAVGTEARFGSVGTALPGVEVRLVDERGEDVLVGDVGEVWVRGPNVFAGYWHDPEATERALTPDGWLRTGDLAVIDDDDMLSIVDRKKDLIIVSGFNVFPAEVEAVLSESPSVAEVAVVGVPHPHTGEAVKAFVVLTPGHVAEEEDLIAFCAERLARYKAPSTIAFVDALPRNLGGKVLRRELRSDLAS